MKKLILLLILPVVECFAQTANVTINSNGTILNTQTVKFGAAKLQVNGVEVFGTPTQTGNSGKFLTTNGTALSWGVPTGSVTSVGISGANGIGVSGSPITSSGTIALSLGAITPTSIVASGTISGSNLSGTNTGDQDLSALALKATTISTTSPLTGGGDLSTNRTFAINNAAADGTTIGAASFTSADFDSSAGNISLDYTNGQAAGTSSKGFLTAADWNTFNQKQNSDGDLTALAALSGTNTIYYRSAGNTWTAVTIGSNMTFTGGTLDSVAGGGGTVTNFSAGDLSPLFTTTEATTTTTPALTFNLSNAAANTLFANSTGGSAAPAFMTASSANFRTLMTDENGTGVALFDGATTPTFATSAVVPAVNGGTAANDDLTLQGTTNATRTTSYVNLQPTAGNVGIGTATPAALLHVNGAMRLSQSATEYLTATPIAGGVQFNYTSGLGGSAEYNFVGSVGVQIPTQTYDSGNWAGSDLAATQGGTQQALDLTSAATGQGVKATSDDTVASASTIDLTSVGPQVDVTGTTTITAVTLPEGEKRIIRFTGALTLAEGASLVLPGGFDIPTANGDYAHAVGRAAGVVEITRFQKASASPQSMVADIDGGIIHRLAELGIQLGSDGFEMMIRRQAIAYSNNRMLDIGLADGDRVLYLGGDVTFTGAFSTGGITQFLGAFTTTITSTADSTATLPAGTHSLAPLDSPTFTGTPTLPTGSIATTQAAADSSTKIATTEFVTKTAPIVVVVKSVAVLTTGTPADIATITIPAGITRWRLAGGNTVGTAGGTILAETAAGTLAGASFTAFDAAGGTGLTLTAAVAGPASAGTGGGWQMVSAATISTSNTIHIRQTANSANAGTISFYLLIQPLL